MNINEHIQKAEQELKDLDDYGDIPPDSYKIFKEFIEAVKRHIEIKE
ncbi:hypothetical protein JOD82_001962 [Paenibacillus sp. 1182]|nr:hypothetical protein [Paenibacillus sp. 1182]MBP1308942.1 hypothetical protein [Paenibacillus sp. 1182]